MKKKIKNFFAFFCEFMHFLKKYEKSAIYNGIALLKTTNRMHIIVNKQTNMHKIYTMKCMEALTDIKMFVQTAKGKYKNVAMIFSLSPKERK